MGNEMSREEAEERRREEIKRYIKGLERYREKGIPVYMDGKLSGPADWERLFMNREDGMFYMGDYVQAEGGGLKEVRFDPVYHCEGDLKGKGGRRRK